MRRMGADHKSNATGKLLNGIGIPAGFSGESRQLVNYVKMLDSPSTAALPGRQR